MPRFQVRFQRKADVYSDVDVEADTEEEAERLAKEIMGEEGPSWEVGDLDEDEPEEVWVTPIETLAEKEARRTAQRIEAVRKFEEELAKVGIVDPRKKNQDEQPPTVGG